MRAYCQRRPLAATREASSSPAMSLLVSSSTATSSSPATSSSSALSSSPATSASHANIIVIRVVLFCIAIIIIIMIIHLYLGFPFSLVGKITVGPKLDCSTLRKSRLRIRLQLNLKFKVLIILNDQMTNNQTKEF